MDENLDMPSRSSVDQKVSDMGGIGKVKFSENFSIKNEFSIDHNFNDINYNDLKSTLLLGNAKFNIGPQRKSRRVPFAC